MARSEVQPYVGHLVSGAGFWAGGWGGGGAGSECFCRKRKVKADGFREVMDQDVKLKWQQLFYGAQQLISNKEENAFDEF